MNSLEIQSYDRSNWILQISYSKILVEPITSTMRTITHMAETH